MDIPSKVLSLTFVLFLVYLSVVGQVEVAAHVVAITVGVVQLSDRLDKA